MNWRKRGRYCLVTVSVVLATLSTVSVRAQEAVDDGLQGRILQRSDGALYIYKDGYKYPVVLADIGDDAINALPDGDSAVGGVAQLFPPPTPAPTLDAAAPVIVIAPTPTVVPGP